MFQNVYNFWRLPIRRETRGTTAQRGRFFPQWWFDSTAGRTTNNAKLFHYAPASREVRR